MAILPGRRLGPYEILSAIGAGGMGEVYKARDTRLDRIVAIKVLPTHLADRSELRERFEREAKTIASLNHPHICVLHDIGHQDGTDYLGDGISRRRNARAAAAERSAADGAGIAIRHRDFRRPGQGASQRRDASRSEARQHHADQVRDEAAGLWLGEAEAGSRSSHSTFALPTDEGRNHRQGTILGTLQYMAPEQVEAKEVDARTDIFAFGAVVYEMATGRKAFEGKTQASRDGENSGVDPPPMSSLQPMTPPALDRVVKKCLAKEPDKRWQTASDLCDELKWIAEGGSQVTWPRLCAVKGIRALGRRGASP